MKQKIKVIGSVCLISLKDFYEDRPFWVSICEWIPEEQRAATVILDLEMPFDSAFNEDFPRYLWEKDVKSAYEIGLEENQEIEEELRETSEEYSHEFDFCLSY